MKFRRVLTLKLKVTQTARGRTYKRKDGRMVCVGCVGKRRRGMQKS